VVSAYPPPLVRTEPGQEILQKAIGPCETHHRVQAAACERARHRQSGSCRHSRWKAAERRQTAPLRNAATGVQRS
jgi:hypothetical protein